MTSCSAFGRSPELICGLMLEMLPPALETRLSRYRGRLALIGRDDLFQEMALTLRRSALGVPLTSDASLERRLLMRVAYLTTRKLRREWKCQRWLEPLEVLEEGEQEAEEDEG